LIVSYLIPCCKKECLLSKFSNTNSIHDNKKSFYGYVNNLLAEEWILFNDMSGFLIYFRKNPWEGPCGKADY